ncbi:hypothetical protein A1O7_09983 [Cladophialophora yegresii CBS 114405]|uniref:Uncharacterized protein n=1 Tax=Cladophialophora yegresii CBS 114405 TaxID=1182544 RepID=W9VG82_9EURO|nr:uncharacterized protein A1O7_09983 [Cladophialophora yegresii CBS 114405]EXJ54642.1 hypothetical protein A1O7_09983 [Cladophialophora yegresii CBS 114405]
MRLVDAQLSDCLRREIEHVGLSSVGNGQRYVQSGFPERYAGLLTWLETCTARRAKESLDNNVERVHEQASDETS